MHQRYWWARLPLTSSRNSFSEGFFPFSEQHRELYSSCGAVSQDDHQPEEPDPEPNTNLTSGVKLIPLPGALAEQHNKGGKPRRFLWKAVSIFRSIVPWV